MKYLKESEVSSGNASGKAGVASLDPFGTGFYKSGNNGEFGTQFTPSAEPTFKTYKSMKHSKKNLKNKKKLMKKFEEFIIEDATATMGNTGGMGAVVAAQPSGTPGDVAGSTPGSGDIGQLLGTYMKTPAKMKKKNKHHKMNTLTTYANFKP